MLPEDLVIDFNVIEQIQTNFKRYSKGNAFINTRQMPSSLIVLVEQFRRKILLPTNRIPGAGPVYSCLLSHGLKLLVDHGQVKLLRELQDTLYAQKASLTRMSIIHSFLSTPDTSFMTGSIEQKKFRVPRYIHNDLTDQADLLGMPYGNAFVLSVMISLMHQSELEKAHRDDIRATLENYFLTVKLKLQMVESLLES